VARKQRTAERERANDRNQLKAVAEPLSLADLAALRAGAYRAASEAFRYPEENRIQWIATASHELAQEQAAVAHFASSAAWQRLIDALDQLRRCPLAELQRHYVALFMVGDDDVLCPPYESVYREPHARPSGWLLARVEGAYRAATISPPAGQGELPDHLAVELEFLALLAARESDAWEGRDAAAALEAQEHQSAFLRDHVVAWLPALVRKLARADRTGAYATVAAEVATFVQYDLDLLELLENYADAANSAT
jgi:TorA maturation chaperone TorD